MAIVGIATNSLIIAVEQYILIIGMISNSGVITLVWPTEILFHFSHFSVCISSSICYTLLVGQVSDIVARWPIGRDPS